MKTAPWLFALAWVVAGWLLPVCSRGADQPTPEVQQALQVLAQDGLQRPPTAAVERPQHVVGAGESLDSVIRRYFPASALRLEVLRDSFVKVNPKVFAQGKAARLLPGTALQVPTRDEVMAHAFGAPQAAQTKPPEAAGSPATAAPGSAEDAGVHAQRRWVRYP